MANGENVDEAVVTELSAWIHGSPSASSTASQQRFAGATDRFGGPRYLGMVKTFNPAQVFGELTSEELAPVIIASLARLVPLDSPATTVAVEAVVLDAMCAELGWPNRVECETPAKRICRAPSLHVNVRRPFSMNDDPEKLSTAIWELTRAGIVDPIFTGDGQLIYCLRVTRRGLRVCHDGKSHPLWPGYLREVRANTPGLTDEVAARLEDARECLRHRLLRPAVVMAGLAMEESVAAIHDVLVQGQKPKWWNARDKLAFVTGHVEQQPMKAEEKHRMRMALTAAEVLRNARNDAAHQADSAFDLGTVEEIVVSAGRQVPVLWRWLHAYPTG